MDSLNYAVAAGGSISINSGTLLTNRVVASNGNIAASGSCFVDADVVADGSISGGRYLGSRTSGAGDRQLPDVNSVFNAYLANATTISYSSTGGRLNRVLLSPNHNPYGPENPLGIYVIDCGWQTFQIKETRILGTLIILNPKSDSKLQDEVNFAPAVANFPSLMIRGNMNFEYTANPLQESSTNLNPPGAAYPDLGTDNDTNDSFPSQISGLVYVSGNLNVRQSATIKGVLIVGGTLTDESWLNVSYDGTFASAPPPGFAATEQMRPRSGTWAPVVR
jgi:hypothetical protein